MVLCFSLTTKQHQSAYKPQKSSAEQLVGFRGTHFAFDHTWESGFQIEIILFESVTIFFVDKFHGERNELGGVNFLAYNFFY